MIIQSAAPNAPHLAITMHDHAALSGQFARAFGNAEFAPAEPLELTAYAIANHDAGWAAFDRDPATDPATGLPYSVLDTPAVHILPTSKGSPDFNQFRHPYCGLLSSMHTWGIYNGRYGISASGRLNRIAPADRAAVDAMLAGELRRQKTLKAELAANSETAEWIGEDWLFQNYKLLQFCDLLALYFNTKHSTARTTQEFTHVPTGRNSDTTVTITPKGDHTYALSPFPFSCAGTEFACPGKPVAPNEDQRGNGWRSVLAAAPTRWETFTFV